MQLTEVIGDRDLDRDLQKVPETTEFNIHYVALIHLDPKASTPLPSRDAKVKPQERKKKELKSSAASNSKAKSGSI